MLVCYFLLYLYSMIFGFDWHNENNICLFQNVSSALSSKFDIENTFIWYHSAVLLKSTQIYKL